MKSYEQMLKEYRGRRKETVVDSLTAGLTCVDDLAVEAGLLEQTGELAEAAGNLCGALPFVVIAATEGAKMVTRAKPVRTGLRDGAFRMVKTGVAMGVGAVVAASVSAWAAVPAAVGVRTVFDRCKSRALTGVRVQGRIRRLQELNEHIRTADGQEHIEAPGAVPQDALTVE